ncbi:MAG: hypothetical protein AAF682_31660 [Planctomycetota bacterium]
MRLLSLLLLALSAFALPTAAQTTGFPGYNDYMVDGLGSGSTSAAVMAVASGSDVKFTVNTAPGAPVLFAFSPCPATPGAVCAGFSTCTFLPATACGGVANQSIDINLGCGVTNLFAVADATGNASVAVPLPASSVGLTFSTQAYVLPPDGPCPGTVLPGLLTQAYDVVVF